MRSCRCSVCWPPSCRTWGSSNALLYADNATFKPDSTGITFQIDGTLFGRDMSLLGGRFNLRAGLPYTIYTKFDGAGTNYDGSWSRRVG